MRESPGTVENVLDLRGAIMHELVFVCDIQLRRPGGVRNRLAGWYNATTRGSEFAADHPDEAAAILGETADGPETPDDESF